MSCIARAASARSSCPPVGTRSAGAKSSGVSGRALSTTTQLLAGSSIDNWVRSNVGGAVVVGAGADDDDGTAGLADVVTGVGSATGTGSGEPGSRTRTKAA